MTADALSAVCDLCGGTSARVLKHGVCTRTDPCRVEYNRRHLAQRRYRRASRLAGRQDWNCPECEERLPQDLRFTHEDHIIPRSRGGPDADWNFQLLHGECNERKREHLTPAAIVLAAEHGVVIGPPIVRRPRGPSVVPLSIARAARAQAKATVHPEHWAWYC